MYHVYALSSLVREYIYAGMSKNVPKRFDQHQKGRNQSTKGYRPFELFHVEEFEKRIDARKREKYLKSGIGKELLRVIRNKK